MADSDSQVQVKIIGTVDPSVASSTQQVAAQINTLAASAQMASTNTTNLNQATVATTGSMAAAQATMGEVTAAATQMHGSVSTATREFRAAFDEISGGRLRMLPGTLAIIGQRVLGLGPAALASVGGVAVLAAGFGYLAVRAKEAADASHSAVAGSALADNLVSAQGIQAATARLQQLPQVSAAVAQQTVTTFASMRGMTNEIMLELADNIQQLAEATHESIPKAAEEMKAFLESPAQNGPKFIDMLGASAAQVQKFIAAAKEGNGPALSAGLEIFSQRMGVIDSKAGDLSQRMSTLRSTTLGMLTAMDDSGAAAESNVEMAENAAKSLGQTVSSQRGHDLAAAMLAAAAATAGLPPSLEQVRAGVERIGEESGRTKTQMVQDQIAYLNAALAAAQKATGSAEAQDEIESMLAEKKVELAAQASAQTTRLAGQEKAAALATVQAEIAATQEGTVERVAAEEKYYQAAVQLDGARSKEAIEAERQVTIAKNQLAQQWLSQFAAVDQEAVSITDANAKQQADAVKQSYQQREISAQQEIVLLAGIEQMRYQLIKNELADELIAYAAQPDQLKAVNTKIEQNELQHQAAMGGIVRDGADNISKTYEQAWQPITNGFDTMVDGILQGNQTLVQVLERGAVTMAEDWIRQEIRTVEQSLIGDQAKVASNAAANTAMTASDSASSVASGASTFAKYAGEIGADAAVAYGNVFAYMSPALGPLAAVPAAAAYALVAAKAALIPSFAVGTNYVPSDMLANIHQGERIIPAADNAALMDAVSGGGSSSSDNSSSTTNNQQGGDSYVINVTMNGGVGSTLQQGRQVATLIAQQIRLGNSNLTGLLSPT